MAQRVAGWRSRGVAGSRSRGVTTYHAGSWALAERWQRGAIACGCTLTRAKCATRRDVVAHLMGGTSHGRRISWHISWKTSRRQASRRACRDRACRHRACMRRTSGSRGRLNRSGGCRRGAGETVLLQCYDHRGKGNCLFQTPSPALIYWQGHLPNRQHDSFDASSDERLDLP